MNIFVTSDCPIKSAAYLDDKRVVKMILESAQLLSNALYFSEMPEVAPYKPTHVNHPCSVWVRESRANYLWLVDHFIALCDEYEARYNKLHACEKLTQVFVDNADKIIDGRLLPFKNCTPRKELPVFLAYQLTLKEKWLNDKRKPTRYGISL
jgi:hypothetical protein